MIGKIPLPYQDTKPQGAAEVRREEGRVVLEIRECPAIKHLRLHSREIVPEFCQHCHYVSNAIGALAGISARICGGNGACVEEFRPAEALAEDLSQIALCS